MAANLSEYTRNSCVGSTHLHLILITPGNCMHLLYIRQMGFEMSGNVRRPTSNIRIGETSGRCRENPSFELHEIIIAYLERSSIPVNA